MAAIQNTIGCEAEINPPKGCSSDSEDGFLAADSRLRLEGCQRRPKGVKSGSKRNRGKLGYIWHRPVRPGQFIAKSGNVVFSVLDYDSVDSFHEGLARFCRREKGKYFWGYLDTTGKVAIEPGFDYSTNFSMGTAFAFDEKSRIHVLDKAGQLAKGLPRFIRLRFDHNCRPEDFNSELVSVERVKSNSKTSSKRGFIDRGGKVVVPLIYENVYEPSEGMVAVCRGGKWGFVDTTGKVVIKPQYKNVYPFSEGIAIVFDPLAGCIDRDNKIVIPPRYKWMAPYKEGFSWFKDDADKYGFVDNKGNAAVSAKFEEARDYHDGLAAVKVDGRWGFIDKSGNFAIEPSFDFVRNFQNGAAVCAKDLSTRKSNLYSLIEGERKFDYWVGDYDKFSAIPLNDYFRPRLKFGLIDKNGKYLIEPRYDNIYDEAKKVFDRVLKVNPDCLGAWVEAGRMYRFSGQKPKSVEAFKRVLELDPGNQLAKKMLSLLGS